MACPFFYPLEKQEELRFEIPPRRPLGSSFRGECRALPEPLPAEHSACQTGYARRDCDRFPPSAAFDAFRFHLSPSGKMQFVAERDGWPVEHGVFDNDLSHDNPILQHQARAFQQNQRGKE